MREHQPAAPTTAPAGHPLPAVPLRAVDRAFRTQAGGPLAMGVVFDFRGEAPDPAALRERVAERAAGVPSLRYRLVGDGTTFYADEALAVGEHVRTADLPGDTDGGRTGRLLLTRPLPEDRPPWDVWLIRRGPDAYSLCFRSDHALRDGMAAVCVARLLLDDGPAWLPRTHLPSRPRPRDLAALAADVLKNARSPRPAPAFAGAPAGACSLFHADVPLRLLEEAGRRHGASVNDVHLAALSAATGAWYRERTGLPHPPMPVSVPLSVRAPGHETEVGNALLIARVTLPCADGGPLASLGGVAEQTGRLRRHRHRDAAQWTLGLLPPALGVRTAVRRADTRAVTTVASHIGVGPVLTHRGTPSERAGTFCALFGGLRCYTCLVCYHGNARLTVVHDDSLTGVHRLGHHWGEAVRALAAEPAPPPDRLSAVADA